MDLSLLNLLYQKSSSSKSDLHIYHNAVRKAEPFSLDDDGVELCAELANYGDRMKTANDFRLLSDLPFESMWLEFDYEVLLDYWITHETAIIDPNGKMSGRPRRLGFLMDRLQYGQGFRVVTFGLFDEDGKDLIGAFAITHTVSTLEHPVKFLSNPAYPKIWKEVTDYINNQTIGCLQVWGSVLGKPTEKVTIDVHRSTWEKSPLFMANIIELEQTCYQRAIKAAGHDHSLLFSTLVEHIKIAAEEQAGDLRFLVSVLATINNVPVRYVVTRPKGSMRVDGRIQPFLKTNVVHIDIPASRRRLKLVTRMLKAASSGRKMPQYSVRGHFRFADRQINERWELRFDPRPEYRRMRWSIHISEHKQGDPSIGIIEHEYDVRGRRLRRMRDTHERG